MPKSQVTQRLLKRFTVRLENADELNPSQRKMLEEVLTVLSSTLDELENADTAPGSMLPLYFDTDRAMCISHINEHAVNLLGLPASALAGRSALDFITPESRASLDEYLTDGQHHAKETGVILRTAHDLLLPMRVTLVPFLDRNDQPRGWRWLLTDVTGRAASPEVTPSAADLCTVDRDAGIACVELGGELHRVNSQLCQMLGYTAQEMLSGARLWDMVAVDDINREVTHTAKLLTGEIDNYTLDLCYLRKDRTPIQVRQSACLSKNEQGHPQYKFVVLEIAHEQRSEEAPMSSTNVSHDLRSIGQSIGAARTPDAMLEALLGGDLLPARRGAVLVFDSHWENTPPVSLSVLAEWPDRVEGDSLLGQSYNIKDSGLDTLYQRDERLNLSSDDQRQPNRAYFGGVREGSLLLFPLIANGAWYGMLAVHCDEIHDDDEPLELNGLVDQVAASIYTMLLAESEVEAHREADRIDDLRMQLMATLADELRTPIMSIQGFVGALLADDVTWDPVSQRDFIRTIGSEANRMQELVEHLVDHARIEADTLVIEPEIASLQQVMEIAAPRLEVLTTEHELVISIPDDLPFLNIDSQRVAQAVINLVSNAVKYSPPFSQIFISARAEGETVRIAVSDEGVGIAPEDVEHIFEPFYQGQNHSQNIVSGLGLGLTISKALIEAQDGMVHVCAPHIGGATVCITLPIVS